MPWIGPGVPEVTQEQWAEWARSAHFRSSEFLFPIRDSVLHHAALAPGAVLLDVGCGDGLIGFAALERIGPAGRVIFSDVAQLLVDDCREEAGRRGLLQRCAFLRASADDLSAIPDESVDAVTARSVLHCIPTEAKRRALCEFHRVLRPGGRFASYDPINRFAHVPPEPEHIFRGYDVTPVLRLAAKLRAYLDRERPLDSHTSLGFDERTLLELTTAAGFSRVELEYRARVTPAPPGRPTTWEKWASAKQGPSPGGEISVAEAIAAALTRGEAARFVAHLKPLVEAGATATRESRFAEAYVWAIK